MTDQGPEPTGLWQILGLSPGDYQEHLDRVRAADPARRAAERWGPLADQVAGWADPVAALMIHPAAGRQAAERQAADLPGAGCYPGAEHLAALTGPAAAHLEAERSDQARERQGAIQHLQAAGMPRGLAALAVDLAQERQGPVWGLPTGL